MADYDVGVTGLSSPPSAAVLTQYRPAVSVRNNGIHDAIASGYVRIYAAGLLIFESEVYSNTLEPGDTGDASAVDYWTPPDEGTYMVQGYVSTPLDQVEPNNNLHPVLITVSGGPIPPPTPVEPHAPQHEEGGQDEVSIDGLKGRAADAQTPLSHVASHQAGGADQLNVGSLQGELASPQTPKTHGNAYHSPAMSTAAELLAHNNANAAHSAAENLANRETSGKLTGLVPFTELGDSSEVVNTGQDADHEALLRETDDYPPTGRRWGFPWPMDHHAMHEAGGRDPVRGTHLATYGAYVQVTPAAGEVTLLQLDVPDSYKDNALALDVNANGRGSFHAAPGATLRFTLYIGGAAGTVALLSVDVDASLLYNTNVEITGHTIPIGSLELKAYLRALSNSTHAPAAEVYMASGTAGTSYDRASLFFRLTAQFIGADPNSTFLCDSSNLRLF
jgi:hypothetical protein